MWLVSAQLIKRKKNSLIETWFEYKTNKNGPRQGVRWTPTTQTQNMSAGKIVQISNPLPNEINFDLKFFFFFFFNIISSLPSIQPRSLVYVCWFLCKQTAPLIFILKRKREWEQRINKRTNIYIYMYLTYFFAFTIYY